MKTLASRDNQLRMFVAVAKASSLREAAEILAITQPALSKQIRALETALDTKLFLRHGRGMQLTPDGQALFLKVEPLLNSLDAAFEHSGHLSRHGGTLRIATVQTLIAYFIPELSRQMLALYPDVHLTIHCDSSANVVESVERGKADIGFVYETAVDVPDLISEPLFEERLALYTAADDDTDAHALTNLAALKLILPPKPYALRRMVERSLGGSVQPYIECDSLELSLRLVSISGGVTVLPESLPRDMVEDRGLRRTPLNAVPSRRLVAISRSVRGQSRAFDAALEIALRAGPQGAITSG
ncbi:DNA-binding transcriptional regulator, LysR family [Burkholderia sp. WP9]|jgi:LysR family cyn operon transcriptional activator|uniref:LysR family transcriptional regulator n=1 Tax=Burkholderia sp. WP9 TaxID=1500263 RepID=UPI0008987931|nr:LysR family transcriptional regulator [Burkholderia sp. WP9]SEE98415.1 DNA-binding transcriptional regulator, LysR family [Burkholderia sp. WP9]